MTDKDRLVELIKHIVIPYYAEQIADHLLDNGVIVPPCKVGDVIYKIMDIESVRRQILEVEVLSIRIEDKMIFFVKTVKNCLYRYAEYPIDDFGKTVFLTKEEAERELERRKNENNIR